MDFDSTAFQDKFAISHQRDSGDESTTSSFGSPSGGLDLLWSAVQEVTSSSESEDTSYELFDQTARSTTTSDQFEPNNNSITTRREGTAPSRKGSSKATTTSAAASRGQRAAARSQKLALLPELNDSPFLDLDSVAPLGKRQQTALSCMRCRTTHKKCDESRPCQRCIKLGCENDCHDALPRGQSKPKWKALTLEQKQQNRKQQSWHSSHKSSSIHASSANLGHLEHVAPFMAEDHNMLPPRNSLAPFSEWPRQLQYHPYPYYSPPSYLPPLPSSISSSSGSSSSLSPPRLPPLPTFNEDSNRTIMANVSYGLPCLPPPAQSYYTVNPYNHSPALFR